jgi:hypothetical protein
MYATLLIAPFTTFTSLTLCVSVYVCVCVCARARVYVRARARSDRRFTGAFRNRQLEDLYFRRRCHASQKPQAIFVGLIMLIVGALLFAGLGTLSLGLSLARWLALSFTPSLASAPSCCRPWHALFSLQF